MPFRCDGGEIGGEMRRDVGKDAVELSNCIDGESLCASVNLQDKRL